MRPLFGTDKASNFALGRFEFVIHEFRFRIMTQVIYCATREHKNCIKNEKKNVQAVEG
jgi:hypothetical protein